MTIVMAALLASLTGSMPQAQPPHSTQMAMMCFLEGERMSGLNKICFYNCAGSEAAITVAAYSLCPLNISQ